VDDHKTVIVFVIVVDSLSNFELILHPDIAGVNQGLKLEYLVLDPLLELGHGSYQPVTLQVD
jgi:hypothetical protein